MTPELLVIAPFVILIAGLGLVAWLRQRARSRLLAEHKARSQGLVRRTFVCAGCSRTIAHTERTLGAASRGANRIFCGKCHGKWRDRQPPGDLNQPQSWQLERLTPTPGATQRASSPPDRGAHSPSTMTAPNPGRAGCLTAIAVVIAVPLVSWALATYA